VEDELQEERKLPLAYKNKKQVSFVRTRILFDDNMTPLPCREFTHSRHQELGPAQMPIDEDKVIVLGNEVFKRKMEGDENGNNG